MSRAGERRASTSGPSCSPRRRSSACGPPQHVTFMVIASPAGAYFKGGIRPVTLWLSEHYTRAGRGGMGAAKTGGNYASSLLAAARGLRAGLRPGRVPRRRGEHVRRGARRHEPLLRVQATAASSPRRPGTILEGITRGSIIELAGKMGHQVEERRVSIDEWREGVTSGDIVEIFACGTAAVVTPVGELKWVGGAAPAPVSTELTLHHPPGAGGRAVRPRRRHVRLDAPGGLKTRPSHQHQHPGPALAASVRWCILA